MRRALLAVPAVLAASSCFGIEPNPDEYAAPVTIGGCPTQRCGADPAALIGTWKLERGCADRNNPFGCDGVRFSPSLAAAGTISFTETLADFTLKVYSENSVEVPLFCFGADSCAQFNGFLSPDSICVDIGEGFCRCDYSLIEDIDFEIAYTVEGDQLRTSFGDYDLCLQDGRLSLTQFTSGEQDLENYTLVRDDP